MVLGTCRWPGCVIGCLGIYQAVVDLRWPIYILVLASSEGVLEQSWAILAHLWAFMHMSQAGRWLPWAILAQLLNSFEFACVLVGSSLDLSCPCFGPSKNSPESR